MWGGRAGALLRVWGLWPAGVLGRRPLSCNAASLAGSNPSGCWNCGSPGGPVRGDGFFCPQCRALQPPDLTRDYFSLMDCNRSFRVDTAKLQQRYQQLQRLVHPDFFSQRSQTEKDFSEKHSTLVNDAYKTLLAPLSRGLYLLKLRGVEIPEGTDYEMDRQFLMEIMEMNEKLAEAQSEAAMKEIESVVRAKQKELTDNVSRAFERGQSMEDARVLVDFLSGPSTSSSKCKGCPFMICGGVEFFEVYIKLCGFRSWRKGATVRQAESQ
ncbi:iron-sulfur cluster co-chaperone protein HscB isoform X1 [Equus quagga]|uniref:iron-sulfur cluster co-chaperone protein HscB isoform X1 n=1 Tax=Equus quagga TaxID=89248 RepID=UPI001EE2F404|nr:iron-sulfur cluster co-chaperone protein HscB isoform X1 [Equus quagga]